jgi:diguanylate cyclase (GGDEF)-like protein
MLTVATIAAVAALALVAGMLIARGWHDRRYGATLRRVDEQIAPISDALQRAVEHTSEIPETDARELPPGVERLLERIAAEGASAHAFRRLADEVASERPAPSPKQPPERDVLTGVRSRSGYEAELEREVARAQRTGRPLSLVLLDLGHTGDTELRAVRPSDDPVLREFAALLLRVTRVTDTVCRRRDEEFGVLLPETTATGARHFHRRVREAVRTSSGSGAQVTFASGIVEWRGNETREAFDARASTAVGRPLVRSLEPPEDGDGVAGENTRDAPRTG